EGQPKIDAGALEALLEREILNNWSGTLVERKQVQAVLGELALGAANPAADQPKLGKLLGADYLILVRALDKKTTAVLDAFPSAAVLHESEFGEGQNEVALAKRIAIGAIETDKLDENRIYVSIGSLISEDQFRRNEHFDEAVHEHLRKGLANRPGLVA